MFGYITKDELATINLVHDAYGEEFKKWSDENEEVLNKWYDEHDYLSMKIFEVASKFAYYCASKFLESKGL